jgi:hypothetical protein
MNVHLLHIRHRIEISPYSAKQCSNTVGDHDFAMTPDSFTRMRGRLPHPRSQIDVIQGGSHAVFKTHADSFNVKIAA